MLFDKVAADLICTLNWSHILNFMELNESCLAVVGGGSSSKCIPPCLSKSSL